METVQTGGTSARLIRACSIARFQDWSELLSYEANKNGQSVIIRWLPVTTRFPCVPRAGIEPTSSLKRVRDPAPKISGISFQLALTTGLMKAKDVRVFPHKSETSHRNSCLR